MKCTASERSAIKELLEPYPIPDIHFDPNNPAYLETGNGLMDDALHEIYLRSTPTIPGRAGAVAVYGLTGDRIVSDTRRTKDIRGATNVVYVGNTINNHCRAAVLRRQIDPDSQSELEVALEAAEARSISEASVLNYGRVVERLEALSLPEGGPYSFVRSGEFSVYLDLINRLTNAA